MTHGAPARAALDSQAFRKRIYSVPAVIAALVDLARHGDDIRAARRSAAIDRAFAEKLMLAVTGVNQCRYCLAFHRSLAARSGLGDDEIHAVVTHRFGDLSAREVVALAYAQHYAERGGRPDPDSRTRLTAAYGPGPARDIHAYLRLIMIGNLLGNTFDALVGRLRGRAAPGSSATSEIGVLIIALLGVPLVGLSWIAHRLMRR
jgi:AhpD family alkylhydroperoxidase